MTVKECTSTAQMNLLWSNDHKGGDKLLGTYEVEGYMESTTNSELPYSWSVERLATNLIRHETDPLAS